MDKRFIKYFISRIFKSKISWQSAIFDTNTQQSIYASDFMFKAEDLKHW